MESVPKSFLDVLGRLTTTEEKAVADKAQRDQESFINGEVARIDNARKNEQEADLARSKRRDTLSMAWAAAELLKSSNVPLEPWINKQPQYETKKGLFRTKEVFVQQLGSVAFESWRLHDMESSQPLDSLPIETILSNVHTFPELETREARIKPVDQLMGLALTSDGDVGFVRRTTTLSDAINGRIRRSLAGITDSPTLTERITGLVNDQRYGIVTYDLLALDADADRSTDDEFAKFYAKLDTSERFLKSRSDAVLQLINTRNNKKRHALTLMESMRETNKNKTKPKDIDVDTSVRQSIARLLATNNISLE